MAVRQARLGNVDRQTTMDYMHVISTYEVTILQQNEATLDKGFLAQVVAENSNGLRGAIGSRLES